ncbi:MAG: hypothetical protein J6N76_10895 [Lachnospiraceae bacterium]|nr:hypothetical protein [Lachnospiraceae bacterium]
MKIRRIAPDERGVLEDMDPFDILYMSGLPGYYCMGAFLDDASGEVLAGVILFGVSSGITIEWLYVKKEYRSKSIGEKLIRIPYDMAVASKTKSLYAYIADSKRFEKRLPAGESFFSDRYFERAIKAPGIWHQGISDILSSRTEAKPGDEILSETLSLSELTAPQIRGIISKIKSRRDAEYLCDFSESDIDKECSVACGLGDKGALILIRLQGRLVMVGYYADSMETAAALFYQAAKKAASSCPFFYELYLIFRNKSNEEILKRLSGNKHIPGRLLSADIIMYIGAMNEEVTVQYDFLEALLASEDQDEERNPKKA